MRFVYFILVLFFSHLLSAQTSSEPTNIKCDKKVENLFKTFVTNNKAKEFESGYRIQVVYTPDRTEMEYQLNKFNNLYPFLKADWQSDRPYYKVLVGAFKTELEATRIVNLIKKDFPAAVPTVDHKIKITEFL